MAGMAPAARAAEEAKGTPVGEVSPLERFDRDPRAASEAIAEALKHRSALRNAVGNTELFNLFDSALGSASLQYHNAQLSALEEQLRRAAGGAGEAEAKLRYDRAEQSLRGRALVCSERLETALELVKQGHIDLKQAQTPAGREQLAEFLGLSAFVMRHELAESVRGRTVTEGKTDRFGVFRPRHTSYLWEPTAVRCDGYLTGASTAAALEGGEGALKGAKPEAWQSEYLKLREAQSALAQRFPRFEDFLGAGGLSTSSNIRYAANSLGALERRCLTETDPARQAEAASELKRVQAKLAVECKILTARYQKLGELIDTGRVVTADLPAVQVKEPAEYERRITKIHKLLQLSASTMAADLEFEEPKRVVLPARREAGLPSRGPSAGSGAGGTLESEHVSSAVPGHGVHTFRALGVGPNGDAVTVTLDLPGFDRPGMTRRGPVGLEPDPRLECALLILSAKSRYASMITPALDQIDDPSLAAQLSHAARKQFTATQSSDPNVDTTRRRAYDLTVGRAGQEVFGVISQAANKFRDERLTAERTLHGDALRTEILKLRSEAVKTITAAIYADVKASLPGAALTPAEVEKILFSDKQIEAALKRAELREARAKGEATAVPRSTAATGATGVPLSSPAVRSTTTVSPEPAPVRRERSLPERTPPVALPTPVSTSATEIPLRASVQSPIPLSVAPQQVPLRQIASLGIETAQPLMTLYAEGVVTLQLKLPDGNLVVHDLVRGTSRSSYGRPLGEDVLRAAGLEVRSWQRPDGTYSAAVLCKYPGEVAITAMSGRNDPLRVTRDNWPSNGGVELPAPAGTYTVQVRSRESHERNLGKLADARALGDDQWHRNLPGAVSIGSGRVEYAYSSEDRRLYGRSPDGAAFYAYDAQRNVWHTVPRSAIPPVLTAPEAAGRDAAAEERLRTPVLTQQNRAALATYYTQNASLLEVTVAGRLIRYDIASGKAFDAFNRPADDVIEQIGLRVASATRQLDGNYDCRIEITKPGSFQISSLDRDRQHRTVSRGVWATELVGTRYASRSYRGDSRYAIDVADTIPAGGLAPLASSIRATGADQWMTSGTGGSGRFAYSAEDQRLYSLAADGKQILAYNDELRCWHEVQAGELPAVLRRAIA